MKEKSQAWNFTYFGGTVAQRSDESQTDLTLESTQNQLTMEEVFPLSRTQVGDRVVVQQIQSDKDMLPCLRKMSFTVGSEVQVTSKTTSGSIVVSIQDKQIGLGAEMANQVMVTLVIDSKP